MKKIVFTICLTLIFAVFSNLQAQNWSSYLQFETGLGLSNEHNYNLFQIEYGKTYKWLDLGLALNYQRMSWQTYYISGNDIYNDIESGMGFLLNVRFDILKMLTKNAHDSFKIGLSPGLIIGGGITPYGLVSAIYEYHITREISLGAFFDYNIAYFGVLGLSIRRNF
jgi:hypothetical protein